MNLKQTTGIVFIIAAIGLGAARFIYFPGICTRGLECASLFRTPAGPFRANFHSDIPEICGDLSSMAHRADVCVKRSEIWYTDPWGYRNTSEVFERYNELVAFGDSFIFGTGITQVQTAAPQITKITGKNTYDAGGKIELNYLRWLVEHFKRKPKTLIYFHLERHHLSDRDLEDWYRPLDEDSLKARFDAAWETLSRYNPLKILATRLDKKFLVPEVFPNRFEDEAVARRLKNGAEFLFLPSSVSQYGDPRIADVPKETDFFVKLKELLKGEGVDLLVVLLPEKFTPYAPLLADPPKNVVADPAQYLDQLETSLNAAGINCLNMLPVFTREASRALEKNEYIYWPDDTHWNPDGIRIMAEQLKTKF